jgi:hypothetical protein
MKSYGYNTPPLGAEPGSRACPGVHTRDSGESIPHFFSNFGNPSTLSHYPKTYIKLVEERNNAKLYSNDSNNYYLYCPKIIVINANFEYENNIEILNPFKNVISIIQKNISAKKSSEYLFDYIDSPGINLFAGSGSVQTYRENLCKRLSEAFYNVEYIFNSSGEKLVDEFKIYENTLLELDKVYGELPYYLVQVYKSVKARLNI